MLKTVNNERIYHDQYNNMAYAKHNGTKDGCEVTASSPNALSVEISAGNVFFTDTFKSVSGQTLSGFVAPDGTNKRMDLVGIDNTGTPKILSGETYKHPTDPRPPEYDPDSYVIIARITFDKNDTVIQTSNIKDMRVLNEGGATSSSSDFIPTVDNFYDTSTGEVKETSKPYITTNESFVYENHQFSRIQITQ